MALFFNLGSLSHLPSLRKPISFSPLPSLSLPLNPLSSPSSPLFSKRKKKNLHFRRSRSPSVAVFAVQSNWLKVLQTAVKVGRDGIEAGTRLVPDPVPRSVARIGVAVVAVTVSLFVLKSVVSTAFFVLAMMGFIYFVFIALNKDEGPRGGGGTGRSDDENLEEARRIMEKYK